MTKLSNEGSHELVRARAESVSFLQLQRLVGRGGKEKSSPKHKFKPVCMSRIAFVHTLYQQAHSCTDLAGAAELRARSGQSGKH